MILEKEICVTVDFLFCFLKSCSSLQSPLTVKLVCDYMIKNRNEYEYLENGVIAVLVFLSVIFQHTDCLNNICKALVSPSKLVCEVIYLLP